MSPRKPLPAYEASITHNGTEASISYRVTAGTLGELEYAIAELLTEIQGRLAECAAPEPDDTQPGLFVEEL